MYGILCISYTAIAKVPGPECCIGRNGTGAKEVGYIIKACRVRIECEIHIRDAANVDNVCIGVNTSVVISDPQYYLVSTRKQKSMNRVLDSRAKSIAEIPLPESYRIAGCPEKGSCPTQTGGLGIPCEIHSGQIRSLNRKHAHILASDASGVSCYCQRCYADKSGCICMQGVLDNGSIPIAEVPIPGNDSMGRCG